MRYSQFFLPTVKEIPSDAETASHQLMIRGGMIRKLATGIYSYLPLGWRVVRKVEQIVREEMNRAGALEVFLPMVQPAELWQESGRWSLYGKELLRFKDRHDRDCCLGPTHEEVITDLVRSEIKTYRQLPRNLYQIQTKFRDEVRPRFGVMRCREFSMKDAYSFDIDNEGADISYQKMFAAYQRIFSRCGLLFRAVEADTGSIGGRFSHEFMVMADTGEDEVVYCDACSYAANLEKAEIARPEDHDPLQGNISPCEEVHTPNVRTIDEVCAFFQVDPKDVVKTIVFNADGTPVAVLIRGDEEINEIKVRNYLSCNELELADDEMIMAATGAPRGFAGALGIKARVIADYSLIGMRGVVMGANREDYHIKNVCLGRDICALSFADLRAVRKGDVCPRCRSPLTFARGIEVGHVFKLGLKYSKAMKAVYLDNNGKEQYMVMGCYGIGVTRTVAAAIEQYHDDDGMVWPVPIAPFQAIITPVNMKEERLAQAAEKLYQDLLEKNLDVLLDDRDERAGVKFNDADLIGIPYRVTIGPKKLDEGKIEIKNRRTGDIADVDLKEAADWLVEKIKNEQDSFM